MGNRDPILCSQTSISANTCDGTSLRLEDLNVLLKLSPRSVPIEQMETHSPGFTGGTLEFTANSPHKSIIYTANSELPAATRWHQIQFKNEWIQWVSLLVLNWALLSSVFFATYNSTC